jgi:hypothetical protein
MSSPILAGKLTFSFYVNEDFETTEIGKSDVYTYYVEVLDESLDQIWAGWAMPEEYTEAYHNTPYVATVVASDGLEELKNVNYPLQDGKATLFTHLQNCLITTFVNNNIFESVNIYSNGMNSTASDSPFKQAQVTYNSFRSISETPKAYEVLSSLLVPFFARIYQYRGWRIEAILEKRSSYVVREYDVTGAFVGQSTFNPLVKFDTDYNTFRAFIQKSGQLSIRPALNNAEVYFNTVEPVEPTTTGGFQNADDWNSTTNLKDWTAVAGVGANPITIEQVHANFDGNEFAVRIAGRKTTLEQTDYIESDSVNISTADYESINVEFAHYANWPRPFLIGLIPVISPSPILYFEVIFTETSSGDVYNWSGAEWVLIPLGQAKRRLRIDFTDRTRWKNYSASIDSVPSTGTIKFRFYKLIKSGSEGNTALRLTAWKTNLIVSQPTNAALLLEAGTTNVFTQYKGPSFPHIISDGTVLNASGVMDVSNTLTATWARRGVTESLNIRRLFLTQWLSFNSRPTEILSGVIHQKGEVITPMSVVKDKDAIASTRYVMQSYEMSLGTGIGSASYREIVMEDANINAFQEFLDSIRLGDFFATTVNYNIFIGGAPGLSPGANPGQIDLNFSLNGDVKGGLNQAEITPAAIQNKARLDLTGLTANDIVIGAVKDSPDQENMTNLRLSDVLSVSGSITGNLTSGYIPRASGASTLTDSAIFETGTNILIGSTTSSGEKLQVTGTSIFKTSLVSLLGSNPVLRVRTTDNTSIVNFANAFNEDAAGIEMSSPANELAIVTRVSNKDIRIQPNGTGKIKLPNVPSGIGDVLGRDASNNLVRIAGGTRFIQSNPSMVSKQTAYYAGQNLSDAFQENLESIINDSNLVGSRSFVASDECSLGSVYVLKGKGFVTLGGEGVTSSFSIRLSIFGNETRTLLPIDGPTFSADDFNFEFEIIIGFLVDGGVNKMNVRLNFSSFNELGSNMFYRSNNNTESSVTISGTSSLDVLAGLKFGGQARVNYITCQKIKS